MITALVSTLTLALGAKVTVGDIVEKVKVFPSLRVIATCPAPTGSKVLVALENKDVRIFDAKLGLSIRTLTGHPDPVYGLAWSPNGKFIATGDDKARIWIWDAVSGKKLREMPRENAHTRGVSALSFSADGRYLASTGNDDVIFIWDVAARKKVGRILGNGINVYHATFMGGGRLAVATLGKGIVIYNTKTWQLAASYDGHKGQGVLSIAASRDGGRAISGGKDGNAVVWSLATKKPIGALKGHQDFVMNVAVSPNGILAATSSSDRSVMIWNLKNMKKVGELINQSMIGAPVCFTGDGKWLISSTDADGLQINSVKGS